MQMRSLRSPHLRRSAMLAAAIACWGAVLAGGMASLARYDARPGRTAAPTNPPITPPEWTVSMYAHPRCPCTRASIQQFAELARHAPNRAWFEILFYRPTNEPDNWAYSDSWDAAAAIRGVQVRTDPAGELAANAGAVTSGHVAVHNQFGTMVFAGGITSARATPGDSAGVRAILSWLAGGKGHATLPVFGCDIRGEDDE